MKKKVLIGLIASATIGTAMGSTAIMNNQNTANNDNKILMVNSDVGTATNEAVVIKGNSTMNLYALSNGKGIVSNLSAGEMLTIISQQGSYCKVRVQETGAVGYVNVANMQNISNGTSAKLTNTSGNGTVINVSTRLRLRSNPSINADITSYLSNGTQFNILGKQGQWYKISVNGQIGFVYGEYVSTNTSSVVININNNEVSSISNSSSQISNTTLNSNTGSISTNSNNGVNNSSNVDNGSSSSNSMPVSNNVNSTNSTTSNSSVKNIIVKTKGSTSSQTSSNINSGSQEDNINKNQSNITQVNKAKEKNNDKINSSSESNKVSVDLSPNRRLYLFAEVNSPNIVDVLSSNTTFTVVKANDGWSYIKGNNYNGYIPNGVLQAAINGENLTNAYKEYYINTLNSLEKQINSWESPTSTNQELNQAYKACELWGNELNSIFNNLLYYLPKDSGAKLQSAQNAWIKETHNNMSKMKAAGGNLGFINAYNTTAKAYKNRCLYLINQYMGNPKDTNGIKQENNTNLKNSGSETSIPVYGQMIPGTKQISYNIIVKNQGKPNATILPKVAQNFTNRMYQTGGAYFTNVEIPQYTYYGQVGGENNVYNYYIVSPQTINTENLKVGTSINPNTLTITNSTEDIKSIQAVGYLSNGLIIGIDSNGQQVYLPASFLKKTIKFAPTQLNVMLKNAIINTSETVPVYEGPVAIKSISTIGNTISNKNLKVVLMAQANGYSEILFGTSSGIFEGWIPTSCLTIS